VKLRHSLARFPGARLLFLTDSNSGQPVMRKSKHLIEIHQAQGGSESDFTWLMLIFARLLDQLRLLISAAKLAWKSGAND
jgi:hypothetical protein